LTRLTLVGSGDLDCELQELGRQLDISELLDFRGYIARESMRDIYASHDVFVLPSFQESMSVAALEALGAGLPLILTRGGGSEEILADGLNGFLVDCGSSAGIAEAILKIERDRALIPLFSEQSRKKAHDFSWSSAAKKILATLHEVSAYTVGGEGPAR
jgi:glycosyltransferase involved in cell wall biosynthesis